MALNASGLESDLADLFASPPETKELCAAAWAQALATYAGGVTPVSTTVAAAQPTLATALASAFNGTDPATTATAMEAAFLAFASTVGGGMTGFLGVPPGAPIGIAALAATMPETHDDAAEAWADAIDTWMKLGLALLLVPPFTLSNWS